MKRIRKPDMMLSITLVFYVCLAVMPFFISGGYQIVNTIKNTFCVFPVNLLIYVTPAVLYIAVRKKDIDRKEKSAFLIISDTLLTVLMYSFLNLNNHTVTFSLAALLILSFVCMNADDIISMATLLPGILIFKLDMEFIFACYIPILLLFFLKKPDADAEKDKKTSSFLPFAYLYISVLAIILLIAGKITFGTEIPLQSISGRTETVKIISGFILVAVACAIFFTRAISVTGGKPAKTVTAILFAVYPVAMCIANMFVPIVSSEAYVAIIYALIIYTVGNAQISLTYENKAPLLPAKIPLYPFAIIVSVLFLFFVAE